VTQPTPTITCVALLILAASACSRPPLLVAGPIEITPQRTIVRLAQPARAAGENWEICFEFDIPAESYAAGQIGVMLIGDRGQQVELDVIDLDRRGEAIVCQVGRLVAVSPAMAGEPVADVVFATAELSAPAALWLRGIRGGARP
jgi:hypothetical protein